MNLDDEKARLFQRDAEWAALASQGRDVDRMVSFWTDDAIVLPPGLPAVVGKAALREYVRSSLQIPGFRITWTSTDLHFSPDGKLAYMFGRNAVTVSDADGNPATTTGRAVTVWRRDADGEWRCAVDIWNAGPAEATTKYKQLHEELRSLQVALRSSGKLSDSDKRKLESQIDEMREHLATGTPSGQTLRNIWSGIEHLVTAGDFVEHASRIGGILSEVSLLELL